MVKADGVIFLGGSAQRGRLLPLLVFISRFKRKKLLMYWTGSDVLQAQEELKSRPLKKLPAEMVHVAAAPWLAEELGRAGFEARFISLSAVPFLRVDLASVPPPLPREFTVLTYVPGSAVSLYGGELIKRLAMDFPDIIINILFSTGQWWKDPPPHVRFLGWVEDPRELYRQSTVLVRMAAHDAIGGMVQEALSYGRHVIWSYPLQGVRTARDYPALKKHLEKLLEAHRRSELGINTAGIEAVGKDFLPALNIKKLLAVMNE